MQFLDQMIGSEAYVGSSTHSFIHSVTIYLVPTMWQALCPWLTQSSAFMGVDLSGLLPSLSYCGGGPSGLGRLSKPSDNSDSQCLLKLSPTWFYPSRTAALRLYSSEPSSFLLGRPIYPPSRWGVCPIFAHSSTTFASASVPETLLSPHSHSSGFAPAASHSHLQISFTWHRIHHCWPESVLLNRSRRLQDRGGQESGGAQASPPSSSFLPALQMGFCEGVSVLSWSGCFSSRRMLRSTFACYISQFLVMIGR